MKHILLVTSRENQFSEFMDSLTRGKTVEVIMAVSSKEAIDSLSDTVPNLVIIDEEVNGTPGLKIARDILMKNAMVNQVVVSSMSSQEFHDTAEGLGIMIQLPPAPDAAHAQIVLDALKKMP
jgi:DNA-binding NarL/FixJ family response regulator